MTTLKFTRAAENDLGRIWDYTTENWGEAQAIRYIREIQFACEGLIKGHSVSRSADSTRPGYRKTACGSHMIYFRKIDNQINVVRILHQSMDGDHHI